MLCKFDSHYDAMFYDLIGAKTQINLYYTYIKDEINVV